MPLAHEMNTRHHGCFMASDEIPEGEITYVPFGTRHVPPPAAAAKAVLNAAVSSLYRRPQHRIF